MSIHLMHPSLTFAEYRDKILGGWIGKCAGGILGAPIEGFKRFNQIPISDELFANTFPNDDLDLQILWLDMIRQKGPWVRQGDFAHHWKHHVDFPWNEYGIATFNLHSGLDVPDSGRLHNRYWGESMGSPIRSEIWGMVCPGLPAHAARYAQMDSEVDHAGFSVDAERFLAASAAIAFVESDLRIILNQALAHIPAGKTCHRMIRQVMADFDQYGPEITRGKIKSQWGDADFTSAPMNVAFTILALLQFGDSFESIVQSLHFGHDSDCIVATAAALIGIIHGYEAIPEIWKQRVGNALVVSPEIVGIEVPGTISELADGTADMGIAFLALLEEIHLEGAPNPQHYPKPAYHLVSEVVSSHDLEAAIAPTLNIHIERFGQSGLPPQMVVQSEWFAEVEVPLSGEVSAWTIPLSWRQEKLDALLDGTAKPTNLKYEIHVGSEIHAKGIPHFGSWQMVGPFMADDPALEPMHATYPDHGLASMPSAVYMNHDLADPHREILAPSALVALAEGAGEDVPFGCQVAYPKGFEWDLGAYFYGRGERTIYLQSYLSGAEPTAKWLCIGAAASVQVWLDGRSVYQEEELKRCWPMAHTAELTLTKQRHLVTIRLDFPTDQYGIHLGLKEHAGKHPHQCQWDRNWRFAFPRM
ncbi:ADP-ribosylglycohydrolase family protein [Pontibacter sp. G13]|uniref:ADP-ribosylglycohydrolase family protein n=1 Tax=Pontibacter sp. G13 TaxID=3074898 RepID=UPI00288C3D2E|nr:ADP-ribosylglycohydrolase family protein [Pontibacter sp. G13]WNJ17709.1 ADP-ribosylglycohydrolase family protein [Pontibacter sp. G13]